MKKIYKILVYVSMVFLFVNTQKGYSQVLISNSTGSPNSNAMLEIESSNKGVLIPRISTTNRKLITATPGLLVFDSTIGSFFLYGKTASGSNGWIDLSTDAGIWTRDYSKGNVFLSNSTFNVGIGTSSPKNRLVIQASNDSDTLLEILDKNGVPLMVVTPVLTRFNFVKPKKGVSGGFAVGRYATAKGAPYVEKYFYTDIDSTRVYTGGGSAVTSGGFAVGRYATAKDAPYIKKYFFTDIDSTRIYIDESAAGSSGGFAVGRYATAKNSTKDYFNINASNVPEIINPSDARIFWYPLKEAFLSGRVLVESIDSVGFNSWASGFESKSPGDYSQALGYKARAFGDNSTAIGNNANAVGLFLCYWYRSNSK